MANMIQHLPQWARPRVQQYIDNGTVPFEGVKSPIDQSEAEEVANSFKASQNDLLQLDNTGQDLDPRPGVVAGEDPFLGGWTSGFEQSDKGCEIATSLGNGQAILYTLESEDSIRTISLHESGGADDVVLHIDRINPDNNYLITR